MLCKLKSIKYIIFATLLQIRPEEMSERLGNEIGRTFQKIIFLNNLFDISDKVIQFRSLYTNYCENCFTFIAKSNHALFF